MLETLRGTLTIRPLTLEDAEAYRDLRLEGLEQHPTAFGGDYADEASYSLDDWRNRIEPTAHRVIFAAVHHGQLVGTTGISRWENAKLQHNATIFGVYVQAGWRGIGLIDSLINVCAEWATEHQVRLLKLGVETNNTAAIRAYSRCGFSVYGVEPDVIYHDSMYYDELLMVRRIIA